MSAKFGPRRKAAFLKALAFCGNQTLAAERVAVSRSWVGLQRASDPTFDAAVRGAIRQAQDRLRAITSPHPAQPRIKSGTESPSPTEGRGGNRPPAGWGFLDGAELVVRGSNGRRTQIGRARVGQWTPRVEARFLAALAATCNVKAACAEVGKAHSSAYGHRQRWLAFARAWDAAIDEGYARIEAALVVRGCNVFSDPAAPSDNPITEMTAAQAIHLLHMHKNLVHGAGKAPGHPARHVPRPLSELKPGILRKLEAFMGGQTLTAAERAADEASYAARRWRSGEDGG